MKKKSILLILSFIIMGLLFILTNSCQKDETKSKKDPVITWTNPTDISFGTLLSEIQLNATADVPGTFIYTPTLGTKLNEGANQDLKVDFTPTDETNYNTASKTVKINVTASNIVTDIDGNVYNTVTIGTQTWMTENLKVTKYRNGDLIGTTTPYFSDISSQSTPKYQWAYDGNEINVATYGRLYTWYALTDIRGVCPAGWHVPSDAEWTILTGYLGGEDIAGSKLKEEGLTHWKSPNTGATNETGFTALPGGYRKSSGWFFLFGEIGFWWCSTEYNADKAWLRYLSYDISDVYKNPGYMSTAFSVRCARDY